MNDQTQSARLPNSDPLLNDVQAASIIGTTGASLKQSRYTGLLFGKPAQKFLKMGKSAKYKLSTLQAFVDQFSEFQSTSEYSCPKKEVAP